VASRQTPARRDAAEQHGDSSLEAYATVNLGEVANRHGRYADARPLLERGRLLAEKIGDRYLESGAQLDLGELERATDNPVAAGVWLHRTLNSYIEMSDHAGLLESLEQTALLAWQLNERSLARRLLGSADRLRMSVGAGYRPRLEREFAEVLSGTPPESDPDWRDGNAMPLNAATDLASDFLRATSLRLGAVSTSPRQPCSTC
jgi:hypothetical protein